jgi:membrane-associated phospholipid phosphatase
LLTRLDQTEDRNLAAHGLGARPARAAAQATEQHAEAVLTRPPLADLGPQDWLVLGYVTVLVIALLQGEHGATFQKNVASVLGLVACAVLGIGLTRTGALRNGWLKALLYRVSIYGPVQLSYFCFRDLLPAINPGVLDHQLHAIDMDFFGVEPAIALDHTVSPHTSEWFAFFYFGYFFVLALHVVPILFVSRNQRLLGEFALGMLLTFCIGHTIYMLVPGFGPYRAMAGEFHTKLPHGLWLDLVMDTVQSGGAQKDIFPSLHTAAPTFIALFSFRHRHLAPYRFTWPITAFFSLNIMVATMFLRWHYLIDVVVGLGLATLVAILVVPIVDYDMRRRARLRLQSPWPMWSSAD